MAAISDFMRRLTRQMGAATLDGFGIAETRVFNDPDSQ